MFSLQVSALRLPTTGGDYSVFGHPSKYENIVGWNVYELYEEPTTNYVDGFYMGYFFEVDTQITAVYITE